MLAFDAGPGFMGALATAAWLPWLLIGLPAGAWVDGLPARGVMIAADLVSAAAYASVPLAWWLDVLTLGQLLLVALVGGVATVFFRTAYSVFLPQVVAREHLEPANGRLFGTESAMQIAGPGVGGLLAQWFSAAFGILLDAVSFLVSAACLWRIRPRTEPPGDRGAHRDAADPDRRGRRVRAPRSLPPLVHGDRRAGQPRPHRHGRAARAVPGARPRSRPVRASGW